MVIWCRWAWVLCLVWSPTACARFPLVDVSHQTIPSPTHSPIRASDAGSATGDSRGRSPVPVSFHEPSTLLTARPADAFFGSSTLHLSKNEDGSISVLSDGRSVSLLSGLDPALVNPAVLPFLFPSCEVPAAPVGVSSGSGVSGF
jgi:hypothetical protein